MSDTVITETTADYILGSLDNLELALTIEKALSIVRERLIRKTLGAMKVQLEERCGRSAWDVRVAPDDLIMKRHAFLTLRKKGWNWTDKNWPMGVAVAADRDDWEDVYITVACYEQDASYNKEDFEKAVRGAKGVFRDEPKFEPQASGCPAWQWLENDLRNWSSREFLTQARTSAGVEKIAEDLAKRLEILAKTVEPVFDRASRPVSP